MKKKIKQTVVSSKPVMLNSLASLRSGFQHLKIPKLVRDGIKKRDGEQILIIAGISILAMWQLLFFFFSWEEFGFFYAYQHPDYASVVFNAHGFKNHPIIPVLSVIFHLFDYNPLPYNILALGIFSLLSVCVYLFAKEFTSDKMTGFLSGVVFAAGYYGMGTFTTDTYSGFIGGTGLIILLLLLKLFLQLLQQWKLQKFVLFIVLYSIEVYFFPDRSFAFPGLAFILVLFITKKIFKSIIISGLLFVPLFILLHYQVGAYTSSLPHIQFRVLEFIRVVVGTFGNLFFPSTLTGWEWLSVVIGIVMMIVGLVHKKTRILLFLIIVAICAQLLAVLVNSQYFSMVQSPAHFMASFTIFSSIIIATLLKNRLGLFIGFVAITVILSNLYAYDVLQNHSNILRYFYETIQKKLPSPTGKIAVLIYTAEPRPLSPFIHLPEINSEVYVPGFYHKHADDMKVTQGWPDAIDYIKRNKLALTDFYTFYYTKNDLKDVSAVVRKALTIKKPVVITNVEDTHIVGLMPLRVNARFAAESLQIHEQSRNKELTAYVDWYKNITLETSPSKSYEDRKKEAMIDMDFGTTWIPEKWKKPVSITLVFKEATKIKKIIWAVSRTSAWPARTPTDYAFFVSNDKKTWIKVKEVKDGRELKTGEYKTEEVSYNEPISYLKFEIYQTYEGSLPAIDDILVVPEQYAHISQDEVYKYFHKMFPQICLQWTTKTYRDFGSQKFCQHVGIAGTIQMEIEPRSEEITGFRLVDQDNKKLKVEQMTVTYP